jgi:hypothetical protein
MPLRDFHQNPFSLSFLFSISEPTHVRLLLPFSGLLSAAYLLNIMLLLLVVVLLQSKKE